MTTATTQDNHNSPQELQNHPQYQQGHYQHHHQASLGTCLIRQFVKMWEGWQGKAGTHAKLPESLSVACSLRCRGILNRNRVCNVCTARTVCNACSVFYAWMDYAMPWKAGTARLRPVLQLLHVACSVTERNLRQCSVM